MALRKHLSTPSNAPCTNSWWTATSITPSRRPSFHPKKAKNSGAPPPTAHQRSPRSGRQMLQVSPVSRLMLAQTQLRAIQPTSHPPVRMSPVLSEFALAPSVLIHSIASYARVEGDVDQRHSALARCLADLVTTHTGAKTISRPTTSPHPVQNPKAHAWMSYSTCAATRSASTRRWSRHFLPTQDSRHRLHGRTPTEEAVRQVPLASIWSPLSLEITGVPGYHPQTFIKHFCSDTDHPLTSIRDAWQEFRTTSHNSVLQTTAASRLQRDGLAAYSSPAHTRCPMVSIRSCGSPLVLLLGSDHPACCDRYSGLPQGHLRQSHHSPDDRMCCFIDC